MLNKKAAMFGLESRALKKQFGKLFLVRMQSVASKETRGARIQSNRAAMFGLDARIALAIFGALSVISGAALYSSIGVANAESYRQYFREVIKAEEQYYLDNAKPIPQDTLYSIYVDDLANNRESLSSWNGPYKDYISTSTHRIEDSFTKKISEDAYMVVTLSKSSDWSANNVSFSSATIYCAAIEDLDCSEWVSIYGGDANGQAIIEKMFIKLDDLVDGGDGELTGKIRLLRYNFHYLVYQGLPRIRTTI